jgi:hypothetical protein
MVASLSEPLQHEPPTEERILMMDYASTRAKSEEALCTTPPPRGRWGLAEATMDGATVSSPPPTADDVDKLYREPTEIHAIGAAQLAECAC